MFKRLIPLIIAFLWSCGSMAQSPDIVLNRLSEQKPIEKVYLHLDRGEYIAGQAIWFKAYFYADFLPGAKSTSLFVELVNSVSAVITRKTIPVFMGTAQGQLTIPDSLTQGDYFLRAYSPTMLNYDADFVYTRQLQIFGGPAKKKVVPAKERSVRMEFFPEGGNFVSSLSNTIAFKATNEDGSPATVNGIIKNKSGGTVAEFSSYHDGMGFFDLTPDPKEDYYAILNNETKGKKYLLPAQEAKGIVLRVLSSGQSKSFEILQHTGDPAFEAAYMIGQMQHNAGFTINFAAGKSRITGDIRSTDFFSGILHITVFNKDGIPLAERLSFIDNKEYLQEGTLLSDTVNFTDRSKNVFTLSLKDTVQGSFSVSITDAAFEPSTTRPENIISTLLLTEDIKGYVHDPAYYFSSGADTVGNALDLVMMTNGWRRFRWTEIMKGIAPPVYKDPGYITLDGKINMAGTKKPFAGKELMAFIVAADSSRSMQLIHTNEKGEYRFDSLIFFDKASIFFGDTKGKRSKFIDVVPGEDVLSRSYPLTPIAAGKYPLMNTPSAFQQQLIDNDYDEITKSKGQMLQGITVNSRTKTKQEVFEEKNVSPLFTGGEIRTISLLDQSTIGYANIFDYLQARVPGVEIRKTRFDYSVFIRQGTSITGGPVPPTIYLDESLSDISLLATISADQIAMVKIYSHFVAAPGGGIGGALAVYTKKSEDLKMQIPTAGEVVRYNGYSVMKEFYSPDYAVEKTTGKADNRVTLFWQPDVLISDIDPKWAFSFYNNDRTRQFKVVVEGMTAAGKLLMIEKTVTAGGGKAF